MLQLKRKQRPQFKRDKKNLPPLIIQDRDIEIVRAVFENRFLTLPLLAQLFPPDEKSRRRRYHNQNVELRDTTNASLHRRLRLLFHHHYLYRFHTNLRGNHIYALDNQGALLLKTNQLPLSLSIDWQEKNRGLAHFNVEHALMVSRFRTALEVATREHPTLKIDDYERESPTLKAEWQKNGRRIYVNPDAYLTLRDTSKPTGKQRAAYFLEADQSTMTLQRLLEKFARYSAMYRDRVHMKAYDIPSFRLLLVTKSRERASNVLTLASKDDSPIPPDYRSFFYFTTEEAYAEHPRNIFSPIWRRVSEPDRLHAIVSSPLKRLS